MLLLEFPNAIIECISYRNVPKFSDRQVWANSADPHHLGAVWSGSTLFAIPSASFGHITVSVENPYESNLRIITVSFLGVQIFRSFMVSLCNSDPFLVQFRVHKFAKS